ncbi:hypothetical protein B0T17DRAFT_524319 [Bombardia bombarda]|uniref:Ornithine cyclodeaminase n=1 Tax=Bombardia bombarda TaxID=252184 RepID=A0AA39X7Z1_9PEZI|nr:hypothetical protein B0T17DRAFT_524319 [Bombardia bombarda]
MTLSILTDDEIRALLENLTASELDVFLRQLQAALHEYSTGTQLSAIHQPERTSVYSATTGATTLFMPSVSPAGHGIKVITLTSPSTKTEVDAAAAADAPPVIRPTGAITLFSPQGAPIGILHASTLTAFRTALASVCLVNKRDNVRTLTVFGCGEQAYWHVRLSLLLRGSTIRHVNLINRRFSDNCRAILPRFYTIPHGVKQREGWHECQFGVLTPGYGEYGRLLEDHLAAADVIFCCTPSTEPLFDPAILTSSDARRKGRLIVAIGSYTPQMHEVPVELIWQATRPHEKHHHHHFHKHVTEGGVVVVDTLDGALKEAGELIEAGLEPTQLVELGELAMLRTMRLAEDKAASSPALEPAAASGSIPSLSTDVSHLDLSGNSNNNINPSFSSANLSIPSDIASTTTTDDTTTTTTTTTGSNDRPASLSSGSSRPKLGPRLLSAISTHAPKHSHHRSASQTSVATTSSSTADNASSISKKKQHQKDADRDHMARWLQAGNVIYKSVGLGIMDLTVGLAVIAHAKEKGVGSHVEGF